MKSTNDRVLLVDDDTTLCELLGEYLVAEGFDVDWVHDGRQAIDRVQGQGVYDVMVLDIMMPQVSGLEVLQKVRRTTDLPIVMLTGRGDDIDRIIGLEMGADDYLSKPCNPRELSARLKAVLRRTKRDISATTSECCTLHGITLNKGTLKAEVGGNAVALTSAEFNLLQLLMQSAGKILSKESLTEQVLHRKLTAYDRSIDVHVSRVRQKLIASGVPGDIIKSIRGAGYQMVVGDPDSV